MSLRAAAVEFLNDRLPDRMDRVSEWVAELEVLPGRPPGYEPSLGTKLGRLADLIIGLDLADRPPVPELLEYLPEEERRRLLTGFGYTATDTPPGERWHRHRSQHLTPSTATRDVIGSLCRVELAQQHHRLNPHLTAQQRQDCGSLLEGAVPPALEEPLTTLVESYLRWGQSQLLALGEVHAVELDLAGGALRADLVIGDTLVETKTVAEPNRSLPAAFDQILCYGLAYAGDQIRQLAVYLPWQGGLLTTSITDLLPTPRTTWAQLQAQFAGHAAVIGSRGNGSTGRA